MRCPNCKKDISEGESQSPWRPFCSERCKLIDLGDWVSERHAIPGDPAPVKDDSNSLADIADPSLIDVDFFKRH